LNPPRKKGILTHWSHPAFALRVEAISLVRRLKASFIA
jgi:hypothetical protein